MVLQHGYVTGSLFGPEWKHVQEWPQAGPSRLQGENEENEQTQDAEDDEYEEEEEEIYITLDLGPNADPLTLGTGTDYQLIGLDTPTPFLKIGNDVFRGTPQHLLGSEIITRDTRDPQNPIKHSHPIIGHTNHRIAFEPVKLVVHSPEPGKAEKPRPSMFARDAPPTTKPAAAKAKAVPSSSKESAAPIPRVEEREPPFFAFAPRSRRGKTSRAPKTLRENPLSTRFIIPTHGEIAADGVPRIDGQDLARRSRRRVSKKDQGVVDDAAEVEPQSEASSQPMQVNAESSMQVEDTSSAVAGPSSAPEPLPTSQPAQPAQPADHNTSVQRVLMPDAPRGYTKSGLPRKKPGPAKGKRKAETIAREKGGVVSMLTGKMPVLTEAELVGGAMEVDPVPEQGSEQVEEEEESHETENPGTDTPENAS